MSSGRAGLRTVLVELVLGVVGFDDHVQDQVRLGKGGEIGGNPGGGTGQAGGQTGMKPIEVVVELVLVVSKTADAKTVEVIVVSLLVPGRSMVDVMVIIVQVVTVTEMV